MSKCYHCGFCCSSAPCSYGVWDKKTKACLFLLLCEGQFWCSRYEEIKEMEKGSRYPMFDGYCSSRLFNSQRDEAIRRLCEKQMKEVENRVSKRLQTTAGA